MSSIIRNVITSGKHIVLCGLLSLACSALQARDTLGYTEEKPLVIVSDWDFHPFEFLNTSGEPAGYNVELLSLILDRLQIPHRFVMQEWHVATSSFENGKADLIHALVRTYAGKPYFSTQKYVNFYNLRVARRLDAPRLFSMNDLTSHDVVALKKDDYACLALGSPDSLPYTVVYRSPKEGLTDVRRKRISYYIWGEIPLSHKLKELGIDSLTLDEIDIPPSELRIVGRNKALVDLIDDQYTRLEQAGELQKLYDKWFRPERVHDDASPVALYILAGLLLAAGIVLLLYRLTQFRVRAAVRRSSDLNNMMTQALGMGDYYVLECDFVASHVRNVYGDLLPAAGMSSEEFLSRIAPEEQAEFRENQQKLRQGQLMQWFATRRWNAGTAEAPQWRVLTGRSIVENDARGPRYIVNTLKDITSETAQEQRNHELGSRYMRIFQNSVIAIALYDGKGRLIEMNQQMRELMGITADTEAYFKDKQLFDFTLINERLGPARHDAYHVCQHLRERRLGIDKYIELRIQPVLDDSGTLVYYVLTSRDVSAERDMYMQQRAHDRKLQQTHDAINLYEHRLHYLLSESDMYVWKYDMQQRDIHFARSLRKHTFSMTIEEFFQSINEAYREEAATIHEENMKQGQPFNTIHLFDYTPVNTSPCWYAISGMPVYDKEGHVAHYFGLARNISYLMDVQQRLREETDRAENSGMLKSAFLANMTHEIRTPLNAIVGFSGLLQMVDEPADRQEFIRIIRNNCDMLLRLINDILEASNMGQSMTIEPEEVDIAKVFDDICQTLEQRVQQSGVPFVKDNPYDTLTVSLDKDRVQQVLTNFVTNAVKYTQQGHIRVGYRQQDGGLYFYCEDTGTGIPKDKQAAVFERFVKLNDYVQGTGLGLSICKAIVEKCGGRIGVDSEEGQGSTFWFWIP